MSSAPSTGDAEPVAAALAHAHETLRAAIQKAEVGCRRPVVVLIDGCSGAGKTTLARMLVRDWLTDSPPTAPGRARAAEAEDLHARSLVQRVALDWLYPGWDGMDAGVARALHGILEPHARGDVGVWRRWDWGWHRPAEASAIVPRLPLIVEGAGLLTEATAALSPVRVWLDSPEDARKRRALDRDGDDYRPHWEHWAAQEQRHIVRDAPQQLATHVFLIP